MTSSSTGTHNLPSYTNGKLTIAKSRLLGWMVQLNTGDWLQFAYIDRQTREKMLDQLTDPIFPRDAFNALYVIHYD